ncbi:MAG: hypothetical protein QXT45_04490 [Candidatus Bilamarchaeaceae archaeon]
MRGQISTELLVIVGLVLVVFIPLLAMVYMKAGEAQNEMAAYQAQLVVFRLAYLANSVGSLGTDTTVYTDIYIPKNTMLLTARNVGSRGSEIQLRMQTDQGESELVEVVKYPLTADAELARAPSYGWARFKITSVYEGGTGKIRIERVK